MFYVVWITSIPSISAVELSPSIVLVRPQCILRRLANYEPRRAARDRFRSRGSRHNVSANWRPVVENGKSANFDGAIQAVG